MKSTIICSKIPNYNDGINLWINIPHKKEPQYFGLLFKDKKENKYVIAWNGKLDFSRLDEAVLHTLPSILLQQEINMEQNNSLIFATFFTQNGPDENDECFETYSHKKRKKLVQKPNIAFARYDISCTHPIIEYGLTAENPNHPENLNSFTEFAVKQPITKKPMTLDFFDWILSNHYKIPETFSKESVYSEASVDKINNYILKK